MIPRTLIFSALLIGVAAANVRADDLVTFSNDNRTPGTTLPGVTVLNVKGDNLVYRTPAGEERERPIKSIFKLSVTGDLAFNAAEDAYADRKYDVAIDNYQKVTRANDNWKIVWAVPRLLDAAGKTKRFDAALAGYIGLARVDAAAAAAIRPALPPKGSKFLDDAARDLDAASRAAKKDPERQALLSLLLDVHLARGDQTAAETTVDQLLKLAGPNADDPKLAGMVAGIRLGQARVAAEAKRWADVATAIDAAAPRLIDPKLQAEALYLRAQAKAGRASASDRDARLDACLDYMRVVAHFEDADGKPFVAQSLMAAGMLLETLNDSAEARSIYTQVVAEFPETPFAQQANQRLGQLKSP